MTMHARSRLALLILGCLLGMARMAVAHPMGNFSVNHYSKITLQSSGVTIQYFIDLAEIPAYQEMQQGRIQEDAKDGAVSRYVANRGAELGHGVRTGRGRCTVHDGRAAG